MGTLLPRKVDSWPPAVEVPNPGEPVRAGGGLGAPVTLSGHNGSQNGAVAYTATAAGVRVRHLGGAGLGLAVSTSGPDVTVQLGTDALGNPTSTAAEVAAAVNAHPGAAPLLVAQALGSGADPAGVHPAWTPLAQPGSPRGSVRVPLTALQARTDFLGFRAGGWEPPAHFFSDAPDRLKLSGLFSLNGDLEYSTLDFPVTFRPQNSWRYLYAFWNGAVFFEDSPVGPDVFLKHQFGDRSRRYCGTFRVGTGGDIVPFSAQGRTFLYDEPQMAGVDLHETEWVPLGLEEVVPPHAKVAILSTYILNNTTSNNHFRVRRFGSSGVGFEVKAGPAPAVGSPVHVLQNYALPVFPERKIECAIYSAQNQSRGFVFCLGWIE